MTETHSGMNKESFNVNASTPPYLYVAYWTEGRCFEIFDDACATEAVQALGYGGCIDEVSRADVAAEVFIDGAERYVTKAWLRHTASSVDFRCSIFH